MAATSLSVMRSACFRPSLLKRCTTSLNSFRMLATQEKLRRTVIYDFHVEQGGKMVPFAGWEMPLHYKTTISEEHLHVRRSVGIFDVGHMLKTHVLGADRFDFMERLVVGDIKGLPLNTGTLTVFTNKQGGILDDLIVTNSVDDYLYVVSNAGCWDKDLAHMEALEKKFQQEGKDVQLKHNPSSLIAVQGPMMKKLLQPLVNFNLDALPFMKQTIGSLCDIKNCRFTRCGYTGEDGVEITVNQGWIIHILTKLLASKDADVKMIGLAARDSLRLEAGLCLYGSDIDETTTPVEASLTWLIGKSRREKADFPGADVILKQIASKPQRRRVGFLSTGPPARGGTDIYDSTGGRIIGKITSGCPSPSLKKNVAMGYVEKDFVKNDTPVKFEIRKKMYDAEVAKMPFVRNNYYMPK